MSPSGPAAQHRAAAAVAITAAAAALGAAGVAVGLSLAGDPSTGDLAFPKAVLFTVVWVVPGVLLVRGRPRSALGWLVLGQALLFGASALGTAWVRYAPEGPGTAWAVWGTDRLSALLLVGIWLVLILLPDGQLPSARWRPVVTGVVVVQSLILLVFLTTEGPVGGPDSDFTAAARHLPNPVGILPADLGDAVSGLDPLLQLPLLLCLAGYAARLRRAGPDERARVVGVLLSASTFVLVVVLGHAWLPPVAAALDVVAGALLAAALTATVLGHRPRVVGSVVRQAFVVTVLVAALGALAVLVTVLVGRLGERPPASGVAVIAAVAALAVHPLRARLARWVDRLMYGDLADPYLALQRLADRTHRAPDVAAVLDGLAASIAASLRVPWTLVTAEGRVGSWGERPDGGQHACADLVSGTHRLGTVTVAPGPDRRLSRDEQRVLADLARHGGLAVQAVLLADALRADRQRLVVTREEERRRLRRELHDGVGPNLAGLTMQLAAVQALVRTDPGAAEERLGLLHRTARDTLDIVRRVAHGLRPPALDELGLVGALAQLAESLGLRARFAEAAPLRLPAAVEVAAFRIAAEALHNVTRHAGTSEAQVALRLVAGELEVTVHDAGRGLDGGPPGVGLVAMRERAEELGGCVTVESGPGAGTRVTARLPAVVAEPEPSR